MWISPRSPSRASGGVSHVTCATIFAPFAVYFVLFDSHETSLGVISTAIDRTGTTLVGTNASPFSRSALRSASTGYCWFDDVLRVNSLIQVSSILVTSCKCDLV